jgi:hypothetical protein
LIYQIRKGKESKGKESKLKNTFWWIKKIIVYLIQ